MNATTDAQPAIRVLIVDDQSLLRSSLAIIIGDSDGLEVVGEAATGDEAVDRVRELVPDVVLMDIRMPGGDGIEATRRITSDPALTSTRVVVLTMFELDEYVHAALRAGASGFLLKDAPPTAVLDAIRRTHSGESLFSPSILTRLIETYLGHPHPTPHEVDDRITQRETEILTLVGRGLSNDDIARDLTISIKTVKTHIGNLLAKLSARDRAQLVIAAYDNNLVSARAKPQRP